MSHWNHRVIKKNVADGSDWFGIHEVFYNDDDTIWSYTENPISIVGESIDDLRQTLEWMLSCLDNPILVYDEIETKADSERYDLEDD